MILFSDQPFIPYIDSLPLLKRNVEGPFMMPIVDKFSDMGTVVMGKVESGECVKGQTVAIYPNKLEVRKGPCDMEGLLHEPHKGDISVLNSLCFMP